MYLIWQYNIWLIIVDIQRHITKCIFLAWYETINVLIVINNLIVITWFQEMYLITLYEGNKYKNISSYYIFIYVKTKGCVSYTSLIYFMFELSFCSFFNLFKFNLTIWVVNISSNLIYGFCDSVNYFISWELLYKRIPSWWYFQYYIGFNKITSLFIFFIWFTI